MYTPAAAEPWQLILNNDRVQRQPRDCAGTISRSNGDYYTIFPVSSVLGIKWSGAPNAFWRDGT
jgi:hypothetical protein